MKTNLRRESGFTMIELILVIAILGILAVAAMPTFTTLLADASRTGASGTGGAIQSAINTSYSESVAAGSPAWPSSLDGLSSNTTCSVSNPCFSTVVNPPVISGNWRKTGANTYSYTNGNVSQTWTYTSTNGGFVCSGTDCR